jgi:hypothetical protein
MAAVAVLSAGAGGAQASFFNKRFCAMPGGSNSGAEPDCSFNTWEQCRASVTGSRYCSENPFWKPEAPATKVRKTSRG